MFQLLLQMVSVSLVEPAHEHRANGDGNHGRFALDQGNGFPQGAGTRASLAAFSAS